VSVPALFTQVPGPEGPRTRRMLAALGRVSKSKAALVLTIFALVLGVIREAPLPSSWRRPVRAEFVRALRQAVGGGLATTIFASALIGIAMVYEALFWLGQAGQEQLIGSILVTLLMREVAPVLVGLIVLGRNGIATAAEISTLRLGGQVRQLEAQGIDPFLFLVLPRATALAIACYTLGVVFVLSALAIGYVIANLAGGVLMSLWRFFSTILGAMGPADFVVFPAKMLAIGLLVALTSVFTGLSADAGDPADAVTSRSFVRGILVILLTSVTLSLVI
jgi:phospholipid/cholesterol/gamma-HCH transport system permease protein